jgi:flagellar biosynthesis/type III secretory pathway M-ring protein FliF/YscJ
MYTFVAAVTFFAVLIAVLFMAVWAAIRMAEEKGRTEGESDLRKAQQDDARRRLENAMAADSKSRADSASGKLREDDGHRRD